MALEGNADENIEQKEYESMSGLVEEFGEEQEQEDIDIVFDSLKRNSYEKPNHPPTHLASPWRLQLLIVIPKKRRMPSFSTSQRDGQYLILE